MSAGGGSLAERFRVELVRLLERAHPLPGAPTEDPAGGPVVVAFSGGLDSTVLLHLLRYRCGDLGLVWIPAHLDHRMRPDSDRDARWVRGLCSAWGLESVLEAAERPPEDEAAAREVRYRFLRTVAQSRGARWILTAHHGDDQAESVLFRAARGAGIRGLGGIAPIREDGVLRPLLPFFREELASYAAANRISWREDPTNRDIGFARNAVRAIVLPQLEAAVPGARGSLARLASLARQEEEAWASVLPVLLDRIGTEDLAADPAEGLEGFRFSRDALLELAIGVRARVVRALARRLGRPLHRGGTSAALEFISAGHSGRSAPLGGGLTLGREFGTLVLQVEDEEASGVGEPLEKAGLVVIERGSEGRGTLRIEGREYLVRWSGEARAVGIDRTVELREDRLRYPLTARGGCPGDRIRLGFGSKKVRKFLAEKEVPLPARRTLPVLVDAEGDVVWIPGFAVASGAEAVEDGSERLVVSIAEDGSTVEQ